MYGTRTLVGQPRTSGFELPTPGELADDHELPTEDVKPVDAQACSLGPPQREHNADPHERRKVHSKRLH
jgi:hypothetical protein